jgi:hypothetical protein
MHAVLHRWCGYLEVAEEQYKLGCLAAGLVASSVPVESDAEFRKKRNRIIAHVLCISGWIEEDGGSDKQKVVEASVLPGHLHSLGYLLMDGNEQAAEKMFQRALTGKKREWGPKHMRTLTTVNNLGLTYAELGKVEEAKQMY